MQRPRNKLCVAPHYAQLHLISCWHQCLQAHNGLQAKHGSAACFLKLVASGWWGWPLTRQVVAGGRKPGVARTSALDSGCDTVPRDRFQELNEEWKTIVYCGLRLSGRKSSIDEKVALSRIDCRFTARVCASDKLCSSFFLLPRARFLSSNNLGDIVMSASISSQTSIGSHYASDLPLFALHANAKHVLAMGARVIGRVFTVTFGMYLECNESGSKH